MEAIQEQKKHKRREAPKTEGEKLRRIAQVEGYLPLKDFADMCGINHDLFYKMTSRKTPIPQPQRKSILDFLGMTEEEFETWEAPDEKAKVIIENNTVTNTPSTNSNQKIEKQVGAEVDVIENNYADTKLIAEILKNEKSEKRELRSQNKDILNKYHELHNVVINVCTKTLEVLEKISAKL